MASVAKFKLADTPRLLSHCSRTQKKQGEHIDQGRTPQNFNMAHREQPDKTDYQFVKSRICQKDVKMWNRKDVNAVCSWAVTFPKELCHEVAGSSAEGSPHFEPNDPEECQRFFQYAYDFFAAQHGEQNVVSAYVHMDENMPHMHFIFTPIVRNEKMRDGKPFKVSAKEALQGCYGEQFQVRLQDYLSEKMGKELHMTKGVNADYEKNVKQLKKQALNARVSGLERQIRIAEEQLERRRSFLRALDEAEKAADPGIHVSSTNGYTVMRDADWAYVQEQLRYIRAVRAERAQVKKDLEQLSGGGLEQENEKLRKQVSSLSKKNRALSSENKEMSEFMDQSKHGSITLMAEFQEWKKKKPAKTQKRAYRRHEAETER